jgi:hypothetical protein
MHNFTKLVETHLLGIGPENKNAINLCNVTHIP